MKAHNDLAKAPIPALFFRYYGPILTSMLSATLYQFVDGIILGRYVGKEATAAIGLYTPILIFFIAFGLALMIGGGILISQNIASGKGHKAQEIFEYTTSYTLLIGVLISLAAPLVYHPIGRLLAGDESHILLAYTKTYLFWSFFWLPIFLLKMVWSNLLNNDNAPKVGRNSTLIAAGLNIVLDILLVIVFPFGVTGAAIATGISIIASTVYVWWYIRKETGHLSIKKFRLRWRLPEAKALYQYGTPSFVSELCFALGFILINNSLLAYGSLAIAVFGLINYISFIFLRLLIAAMLSVQPIMAFNIGAKLPERVLATLRFSIGFCTLLGIVVIGFIYFFPNALISIFSKENNEEFHQIANTAIVIYFSLFLAAGANYILSMYLQSIGKSNLSTICNALKGLLLVALFVSVFPKLFGENIESIWWTRPMAEIATLVLIGIYTLVNRKQFYSPEGILKKQNEDELAKDAA